MSAGRSVRLFALTAAAAAGLAALKLLAVGAGVVEGAPAMASESPPKEAEAAEVPEDYAPESTLVEMEKEDPVPAAVRGACLTSSFKDRAGLSASELEVLQSLSKRRRELDARETDLVTREALIAAAENRVDERFAELKSLEDKVSGMLGSLDDAEETQIKSLVSMYEKMKSDDAARIFAALDDEILLKVAGRMKDQSLASILADMPDGEAVALTVLLATRHTAPNAAAVMGNGGEGGASGG